MKSKDIVYPAIFTKTKKEYLVDIPDLAIATQGKSLSHAMSMARDAIGVTIIDMQDSREKIPTPSDISAINIRKGRFAKEGISLVSLIDVDIVAYRKKAESRYVRRNVTLPSWLDHEAKQRKINVSKVLQEALAQKISEA